MFAFMACSAVFANGESQNMTAANKAEVSTDDKTVSTFYGSKASTNANNPCKGATIRKCGTIETSLVSFIDGQTFVIQQVKDNAGNILSTTNFISPVSVSETKANIRVETIKQGGVFKENTAE